MIEAKKNKWFLFLFIWMAGVLLGVIGFSMPVAHAETYGDFEYTVLADNTVEITAYKGTGTVVKVPATINGKSVTRIGKGAFDPVSGNEICRELTSITLPGSVSYIGDKAFCRCNRLISVNIPDGVTYIGSCAFLYCYELKSINLPSGLSCINEFLFSDCKRLTSITIPNKVTFIGCGAFYGCKSLTSVTIPSSVTSIENQAFENCTNLSSITIPSSVTFVDWDAFEGTLWLANKRKENPLVIANHLLVDGKECKGNVTIPNGVKTIAVKAFSGCTNLTGVTIPDGVTRIGRWTFAGCKNLVSVTIPGSVKDIEDYAFDGCENLSDVVIPEGVTYIGAGAFCDCKKLTGIIIPSSVECIDMRAFKNCKNLANVTILSSATRLEAEPFFKCSDNLVIKAPSGSYAESYSKKVGYSFAALPKMVVSFHTNGGSVVASQTINQGTKPQKPADPKKTDYVFTGWYSDKECTKPYHFDKAVDSNLTLYAGWKVRDLKLNETIKVKGVTYRVTNPSAKAVQYCGPAKRTAKTVTIPATVSFYEIPYNVTSIQKDALRNCKKITKVTVGKNITAIGSNAFYGCKKLKTVTFKGKAVKTIGAGAFRNCTALKKITIPKAVTSIGKNAFRNCKKLSNINIKSTTLKKVGAKAFTGIHKKAKFTVPKKKLKAYKKLLKKKTGYKSTMRIKK